MGNLMQLVEALQSELSSLHAEVDNMDANVTSLSVEINDIDAVVSNSADLNEDFEDQ